MTKIKTSIARQKLINLIVFIATNTKNCGKIKLFKLLFLVDFEHFNKTGKSVTGFEYQAWKFGPVPADLMEEWEELGPDMAESISIVLEKAKDFNRQTVKVNKGVEFKDDFFTPRELTVMADIVKKHHKTNSDELIDITHKQNGAWDKVWQNGLGFQHEIPYELALNDDDVNRDTLIEIGSNQSMYQKAIDTARLTTLDNNPDY